MIGKDMFQEADMTGITMNITKHNFLVKDASKIIDIFTEAIYIATSGRPGPVHIDFPKDIQFTEIDKNIVNSNLKKDSKKDIINMEEIDTIVSLLKKAKKPVFIV
jgi:acetolactate synthase-1/2/3 large subunit